MLGSMDFYNWIYQSRRFAMIDDVNRRTVTFGREVLVKHPKNTYENQRFKVELTDVRGAGETYADVYNRLKKVGTELLIEDIMAFKSGVRQRSFHENREKIAAEYNLF
jgi:hypothetical protein